MKIGEPIALKGQINTPSRETFPFVSSSGVLYFSSDGHPGLGGLDIFTTKIENIKVFEITKKDKKIKNLKIIKD